jgi:hypothetical protein
LSWWINSQEPWSSHSNCNNTHLFKRQTTLTFDFQTRIHRRNSALSHVNRIWHWYSGSVDPWPCRNQHVLQFTLNNLDGSDRRGRELNRYVLDTEQSNNTNSRRETFMRKYERYIPRTVDHQSPSVDRWKTTV